jgi:hypothetical protein
MVTSAGTAIVANLFPDRRLVFFFDVSRDGQRFLMPVTATAGVQAPPYNVILNWNSTLKKDSHMPNPINGVKFRILNNGTIPVLVRESGLIGQMVLN